MRKFVDIIILECQNVSMPVSVDLVKHRLQFTHNYFFQNLKNLIIFIILHLQLVMHNKLEAQVNILEAKHIGGFVNLSNGLDLPYLHSLHVRMGKGLHATSSSTSISLLYEVQNCTLGTLHFKLLLPLLLFYLIYLLIMYACCTVHCIYYYFTCMYCQHTWRSATLLLLN